MILDGIALDRPTSSGVQRFRGTRLPEGTWPDGRPRADREPGVLRRDRAARHRPASSSARARAGASSRDGQPKGSCRRASATARAGARRRRDQATRRLRRTPRAQPQDLRRSPARSHWAAGGSWFARSCPQSPKRAWVGLNLMIGTLLATGLVVVGVGERAVLRARTFRSGLAAQALGIALVGLAGLAAFASGDELGSSFTSELEPRLGVDPTSGYFLFVLGLVGAPAVVFATRYLAAGCDRPRDGRAHRRLPARSRARAVRP